MRFFNWKMVSNADLAYMRELSSARAAGEEPTRRRFDNDEIAEISNDLFISYRRELEELQHARALAEDLQREVERLETKSESEQNSTTDTLLEHMKTDFIAAASHELKTPIAGIEALSDAMGMSLEDKDFEATEEFLDAIRVEVGQLRHLIESLLDLSRFDENPDATSVSDLRDVVDRAIVMHERTAKSIGIKMSLDLGSDSLTPLAKISPSDAAIIVDNLVENALQYTSEGEISIILKHIKVVNIGNSSREDAWKLTVKDTGIGIEAHEQSKVFGRFYRIDASRSKVSGGTGLGLALVKKAAERWGGRVDLQSELGKGSSFSVTLPAA